MLEVKVVNTSNNPLPEYAHNTDSGMDIRTSISEPITLKPLERYLFPTGLYFELPPDCEIQIRPRSGLTSKKGLVTQFGTVDEGYTGEVKVCIINLSNEEQTIDPGERIAQLVFAKVDRAVFRQISKIDADTDRGTSGFGDSGRF